MAKKGILFMTKNDSVPTSIHPDVFKKLTATAKEVDGKVELSFTITFKKASIVEDPKIGKQEAFWPFKDGTMEIEFINPRNNLDQLKAGDNPDALFEISVDWPDGKIGGADALKAKKDEKRETYL
jgi:hypothetical protein